MAGNQDQKIVVGLDIGTTKIVAIVAKVIDDDRIEVIGLGHRPSQGLKKGVVINIESTVAAIQEAISEAELMAGVQIRSVYAGIAGSHIKSMNSHGIVAIRDGEVTAGDVERVIDALWPQALPLTYQSVRVCLPGYQ